MKPKLNCGLNSKELPDCRQEEKKNFDGGQIFRLIGRRVTMIPAGKQRGGTNLDWSIVNCPYRIVSCRIGVRCLRHRPRPYGNAMEAEGVPCRRFPVEDESVALDCWPGDDPLSCPGRSLDDRRWSFQPSDWRLCARKVFKFVNSGALHPHRGLHWFFISWPTVNKSQLISCQIGK